MVYADKWCYEESYCEFVPCPGFCDECKYQDEAQEAREDREQREYEESRQEDWNNPGRFDSWRNGGTRSFNKRR